MRKFLLKTALFVLPVCAGYEGLYRAGFLPIVTTSSFWDQKMLSLHGVRNVQLMAMGSSITFYSLNSEVLVQKLHIPFYNFSSWNLRIGDSRLLLEDLVPRFRPTYVLMCSSLGDFDSTNTPVYHDYTDASRFTKQDFPELFYLQTFHSIHQIVYRKYRMPAIPEDAWGGCAASFEAKGDRRADWGKYLIFHSACLNTQYAELDTLSAWLKERGVRFVFAQSPICSSFLGTDLLRAEAQAHYDRCRAIVEGNGGVYLNMSDTALYRDGLFADPIHLRPEGARIFTEALAERLRTIIR